MENAIRILLLEDDDADADAIQDELAQAKIVFDVRRAKTKQEFTAALDAFKPHLILSDYRLEAMSGLDAMTEARVKNPDLPFLFVSWPIHEEILLDVMRRGATDYVFMDHLSRLTLSVVRALREAQERAELAQTQEKMSEQARLKALGQMASGIAHDFSNALTPVLGFSEILLNHPEFLDNKTLLRDYLQIMNTAAKDAMNIVARLREIYRKRQKVEEFLPLDLRQIVEQAVILTRPKWKNQALSNGVVIRVDTEVSRLPKVAGNDSALREVLTNLIFNAVDAMPRGGAIAFRGEAQGEYVHLEVSDTGSGMSEEVRRHCFEPFFSTKGRAGTGLGLSMVYGVVKRHDGTIEVRSKQGEGTTFVIRLPLYKHESHAPAAARAAESESPSPGRPLRVLVIDDEPLVRQVVEQYFAGDGHAVRLASSAAEGFERFQEMRYDLVVTDWVMPGGGVEEMTRAMKSRSPETPIILLTGFADKTAGKGHTAPVDRVIVKPPTLLSLREAVESVLTKKE